MEHDFFSGNSDMADFDYENALGDKLKAATGSKTLLGGLFKAGVKPASTIQNIKAINQGMMLPTGEIIPMMPTPTEPTMPVGAGAGAGAGMGMMDTRSTGASAGEEEGFFAKNKILIIGGGVVLVLGITALLILRKK